MSCDMSREPVPSIQRSNVTLKTAIPASAARLAAGSATPRPAQGVGDGRGQPRELDQLALLQLGVGVDDLLALPGLFVAVPEDGRGRFERRGHGIDRGRRPGYARERVHQEVLERGRAREQDLALVAEVPEERPLREPRPPGDLGHGGLFESVLAVKLHRGLFQPAARVRLPSAHSADSM